MLDNVELNVVSGFRPLTVHGTATFKQHFETCCVKFCNDAGETVSYTFQAEHPEEESFVNGNLIYYTFPSYIDCHLIDKNETHIGATGLVTKRSHGEDLLFALADLYGYTVRKKGN